MIWELVFTSGAGMSYSGPMLQPRAIGEAPGDALELRHRKAGRIDLDAALGAAEGDVDDRRLPGHPGGQRPDLVDVDGGVVAKAAFVRAQHVVVLHAVAREHLDPAVVHLDREVDDDLVGGLSEDLADLGIEAHEVRGLVELPGHVDVGACLFGHLCTSLYILSFGSPACQSGMGRQRHQGRSRRQNLPRRLAGKARRQPTKVPPAPEGRFGIARGCAVLLLGVRSRCLCQLLPRSDGPGFALASLAGDLVR